MRILFVAATALEVLSLRSVLDGFKESSKLKIQTPELLITGAGMVATAYALGQELAKNQYDLAINLGIAGSFDKNIVLGELVEITEDTMSELGAEDDEAFLPISQMGFGENTFNATENISNFYKEANLQQATAITVHTVHGNAASVQKIQQRLNPQIESMEGAAFFYACKQAALPCLQIRAVSNYVEKRNRDNWQIGLAVKNLNTFAVDFVRRAESECDYI